MKKKKSNLDEMQEQKLLKIEHNAAWLAFWGLAAVILAQIVILGQNIFKEIAGELLVLGVVSLYIIYGCLKNEIWDRKLNPTPKTNIIVSSLSGFVCGAVYFISSYINYHKLLGSLATGVFMFISVFTLTFIALTVCCSLYKKRIRTLEESNDE
ncbi:MAG: DUF6773 family protein [Aminipila sp.]